MEYNELYNKLRLHELWLSGKLDGERLDISGEDLSNMYITNKNFSKCIAIETDFRGSNLSGCNFSGANLSGSNLSYSNISGANLAGANLSNVKKAGINVGMQYNATIMTIDNMIEIGEQMEENSMNIYSQMGIDDEDIEALDYSGDSID